MKVKVDNGQYEHERRKSKEEEKDICVIMQETHNT